MDTWPKAIRRAVFSGSIASILSTSALLVCGKIERNDAVKPTNATSHWLWGRWAFHQSKPTLRHTLVGYAIHHAASIFWATFYEKWFGKNDVPKSAVQKLSEGTAVAALACFVDYRLTPQRLTPGFEKHLSKRALFIVYCAFGVGLALCKLSAKDK